MNPHAPSLYQSLTLATVTDNADPENRGRIKVRLASIDVEIWAPVVSLSLGNAYGVSLLPRREETVVVGFVSPELPLVLGSIWTGSEPMPEHAGPIEDKYSITTPEGTRIVLDDSDGPKLEIETPAGNKITATDADGGTVEIDVQGTRIEVTSSKVAIEASGNVEVQAGGLAKISAAMLDVDASLAKFSGVVKCSTLQADSVIGTSYTPGAGNIW